MRFTRDVCVIGGGGHVGLPLAMIFADSGLRTVIYDIDRRRVEEIRQGQMPFTEEGGQPMLDRVLAAGTLEASDEARSIADCQALVLIVGTPVDEHLNPSFRAMDTVLDQCFEHLRDGQLLILRSTVFPGITQHVQRYLRQRGRTIDVVFCPERVAQGYSLREFRELPQIISGFEPRALERVRELFGRFTRDFVEMAPMEAELCKLMTNAWRYIQFAIVNQFYMIASQHELNFDRILHGCRHNYPRMAGVPGPGFAAGPCLLKDTMQLAAFSQNTFVLGHAGMLVNEGMPMHLVNMAKREMSLADRTAGILGMAFKGESDDPRDSLSYKLRKLLLLEANKLLCSDPYVRDPRLVPLEQVLAEADVLFIGAPHKAYKDLKLRPGQIMIDPWSFVRGPRLEKPSYPE